MQKLVMKYYLLIKPLLVTAWKCLMLDLNNDIYNVNGAGNLEI